ncbi:MAG: response regulator [Phycisphaerales bacterium]
MGARGTERTGQDGAWEAKPDPVKTVRVLVCSPRPSLHRRLVAMLRDRVECVSVARTLTEAKRSVEKGLHDLALIDMNLGGGRGLDLAETVSHASPAIVSAMLGDHAGVDEALRAMRAGATDLIEVTLDETELLARIEAACERAHRVRQREARVARLKRLCHQLNNARKEVSGHVGELCNDLVDAYRELSGQLEDVSVNTELSSLLRQELDIESLLRTLLEYVLGKVGSTNASIFLPSTSGEFSLGAYVNYDCPKDAAEVLMDQLADTLAPRFEEQDKVLALSGDVELEHYLGEGAEWLDDATMLVVACRRDDECLAVISLFRDKRSPFAESDVKLLQIIAEQFATQLARVIRVHHRHLPKDEWGGFETDADDDGFNDIDLAA